MKLIICMVFIKVVMIFIEETVISLPVFLLQSHVYCDEYGNFSVTNLLSNSNIYISIIKFNVTLPPFNYFYKILLKSLATLFCELWH